MHKTEHTPEYLLNLNELRNHTLPEEARSRIRMALSEYADFHMLPQVAERPAALAHASFLRFANPRSWYAGFAAALLITSLMGGTAFASGDTLPGDMLYTVKVNVSEPVQLAFAGSLETKASVHASLAERRLEEAAKLAVTRRLDSSTETYLEHKFSEHVDKTLAAADTLQESGKVDESLSVRTDLEARLEAHNDILNIVADHLADSGAGTTTIAPTEDLIHAIAFRREVVSDTRVALERDRAGSVSKSDTLALVTKTVDSGVVTTAGAKIAPETVPQSVATHIDDAADALTEAQESLESDHPQDTRHAFRKAQEAARVSEVATILLKNKEILMAAGADATSTTTASTTDPVATTTPETPAE